MKIFPSKIFTVELSENHSIAMEELRTNTDITDTIISERTKKVFRGQVSKKRFKVISSEIGRGAVCVFIGTFEDDKGIIEVRIHNAFKVMFSIMLSYPFIGFGLIFYDKGIVEALRFLPILLIILLAIRFIFIELSFRFISKIGLNKLTKTIGIIKLVKNEEL